MPRIVGLTGGIASGKSSVSAIWSSMGVRVIDADAVAREVVQPGQLSHWLIRKHFGDQILNNDGTINRAALGQIIFSDRNQRIALNRRTHPFIILTMLWRLFTAVLIRWERIVVLETPLLYETGSLLPFCSRVVVVSCDKEQQVKRMALRDAAKGVTEEEARKRLESQMPLEEKASMADVVIDNCEGKEQLRENAVKALEELQPSRSGEVAFRVLITSIASGVALRIFTRLASGKP